MLKRGITTVKALRQRPTRFARSRHASFLLFARLAEIGEFGADAYDRLVERVRLPNGTWKQTAGRRLDDVDELICTALAQSHHARAAISVLDLGASTGVTSLALYERLRQRYEVHFTASDLYRDAIAVSGRGWGVVFTPPGEALQYLIGPFVLPGGIEESGLYPVNRALKAVARRRLVPSARAVLTDPAVASLPYLTTQRIGSYDVVRIPLFSYGCLEQLRRDEHFAFDVLDVLQPIPRRVTVVRALNIVTRDYFDEEHARIALSNCMRAVEVGGLLVVGRSQSLATGQTRATCYRIGAADLTPVGRLNGGDELEELTIEVAAGQLPRGSRVAIQTPASGAATSPSDPDRRCEQSTTTLSVAAFATPTR